MMLAQNPAYVSWKRPNRKPTSTTASMSSSISRRALRCAILGAGFAGLSVAWNLLQHGSVESHLCIDIYDEVGIGGGASGVAAGLLHPYSPKVKLLWRGAECWKESLNLLNIAEAALLKLGKIETPIIRRRGILRPVVNLKNANIMTENAQNCLANCRIEPIHEGAAQNLVPNLSVPSNLAFYMPDALNVNAQSYLEGLYLACQNFVTSSGCKNRELNFFQKSVQSLLEIAGDYDAIIICFGARATFLPELSGKLPLRMCRGVISHLELPHGVREAYPQDGPSILSDAWLAAHGTHHMDMGSTWNWRTTNYSREVCTDEASEATEMLIPKAAMIYPDIKYWTVKGAVAGLRAMPPVTVDGSLPLVGCVDEYVGDGGCRCRFWLFTGLGARGLFYHGWIGKLLALAVLYADENSIPLELTAWKQNIDRRILEQRK